MRLWVARESGNFCGFVNSFCFFKEKPNKNILLGKPTNLDRKGNSDFSATISTEWKGDRLESSGEETNVLLSWVGLKLKPGEGPHQIEIKQIQPLARRNKDVFCFGLEGAYFDGDGWDHYRCWWFRGFSPKVRSEKDSRLIYRGAEYGGPPSQEFTFTRYRYVIPRKASRLAVSGDIPCPDRFGFDVDTCCKTTSFHIGLV